MKNLKKLEINMDNKLCNHAKKSYNHLARGGYNVEFFYTYFKKGCFSYPCFINRSASCLLHLGVLFFS